MFISVRTLAATVFLLGALGFPQISSADEFTSATFLEWPRDSQRGNFQASIGMAGFIARQNDSTHGECLERWYFGDTDRAEASILEAMRKNQQYHPRAVIVAMLQKACGPFDYSKR